ncbi:hypothetical protein K502DRAFT_179112 [Neoconidiobolus thromboides FSU 785]|nr:hypothetical protein K502DRAFT_179112 [Neoconidiobolus thromboides FSU 785]
MVDYTELIRLGFSVELRSTMIGNLATLCNKLELPKDVLFESVHHMDRFLTCHKLVKNEHIIYTSQLCFYFAMYLFNSECIPFNEFLNICNVDLNRYKVSRYFKRINYFIMDNYRTYIPINDYIELFVSEQKDCLNPLFKQIVKYLMEVTLYNEKFYEYKKSLIVTSLVQVTKEMLHIKGLIFNSHILNKEKEMELKLTQQLLKHSIKAIPNYPSDHTYSKEYKHVLFIVKSYYGLTETN